jgi:MATE family, multidrug efflux pump
MVGRLGATELAAVGFGGVWLWTTFSFLFGSTTGVQTFVSQTHGAGEPRRCGFWAWQGLYVSLPLTALAAAVFVLGAGALVDLLGPSPALRPLAVGYMRWRALGAVGLVAAMVLTAFFRGLGDTRTPLYATLAANAVNAVLDYGLVFGRLGLPQWGTAGAGLATGIAEWVYFAVLVAAFRRRRIAAEFATARSAPSLRDLRRLVRTGAPIGGQWFLGMTSFAIFTTLIARMGDASMAASQAFVVLLSVSFMQAIGISIAASTLVGRYVGARDLGAAERSFRSALRVAALFCVAIGLLFAVLPGPLLRIFSDDPSVLSLGRPLLLLGALFQVFDALGIVTDGALRGAGDTRWPFLAQLALAWGLFVPLAWLLGVAWGGGLLGAWVGGTVHVAVLACALVLRFRSGAWQRIAI